MWNMLLCFYKWCLRVSVIFSFPAVHPPSSLPDKVFDEQGRPQKHYDEHGRRVSKMKPLPWGGPPLFYTHFVESICVGSW